MPDSFGGRIDLILDYYRINASEFAKKLALSPSCISDLRRGRIEPSGSLIRFISITYNVNEGWLKNGAGEMFKGKPTRQTINTKDIPKETFKEWLDEF